jgi:ribosomal protein L40E
LGETLRKERENMGADENLANKAEKRTEAGPLTVRCPKCGTVNLKEATNCRGCGINLQWAAEHPEEEWRRQAAPVPSAPAFDEYVENEIKKHARGALTNAIISIFFFGIILGPLAFQRASKAIRLIREHKIGQEHEGRAKAAQIIAIIALCLWLLLVILQFGQR